MKGGKSLGDAINLTYDPSVCTSPQDCANQTIESNETQNAAVTILDGTRGGGKKRRLSKQKGGISLGGILDEKPPPPGMEEVKPLPQGSSTNATQENNLIMNKEFDKINANASYDNKVADSTSKGGGLKKHKRKSRKKSKKMRKSKKSKKSRKSRKSRKTKRLKK